MPPIFARRRSAGRSVSQTCLESRHGYIQANGELRPTTAALMPATTSSLTTSSTGTVPTSDSVASDHTAQAPPPPTPTTLPPSAAATKDHRDVNCGAEDEKDRNETVRDMRTRRCISAECGPGSPDKDPAEDSGGQLRTCRDRTEHRIEQSQAPDASETIPAMLYVAARADDDTTIRNVLGNSACAEADAVSAAYASAGLTPLHVAAMAGSTRAAAALLESPTTDINARTARSGTTPLFYAVRGRNTALVTMLLRNKPQPADVDATAEGGATPLHVAARTGYAPCVAALLKAGAAVNTVDGEGRTPLMDAVMAVADTDAVSHGSPCGAEQRAQPLTSMQRSASDIPVQTASIRNQLPPLPKKTYGRSVVDVLLRVGAAVHAAEWTAGMTPLSLAAQAGNLDAVAAVLRAGADPLREDLCGHTPLALAVIARKAAVVEFLLNGPGPGGGARAGAGVARSMCRAHDRNGRSPVWHAARKGEVIIARKLIEIGSGGAERGAYVSSKDTMGVAPLHAAAVMGHTEMCQVLLQAGADPLALDREGTSALGFAAMAGHADVVELLMKFDILRPRRDMWTLALPVGATAQQSSFGHPMRDDGRPAGAVPHANGNGIVNENAEHCEGAMEASRDPVLLAAQNGHAHVLVTLLKTDMSRRQRLQNPKLTPRGADTGATAVHIAAQEGHVAALSKLADAGASVDERNTTDGAFPLWTAAARGHAAVVRELVGRGADVTLVGPGELTALCVAAATNHADVVDILLHYSLAANTTRRRPVLSRRVPAAGRAPADVSVATPNNPLRQKEQLALQIATAGQHEQIVRLISRSIPQRRSRFFRRRQRTSSDAHEAQPNDTVRVRPHHNTPSVSAGDARTSDSDRWDAHIPSFEDAVLVQEESRRSYTWLRKMKSNHQSAPAPDASSAPSSRHGRYGLDATAGRTAPHDRRLGAGRLRRIISAPWGRRPSVVG